MTPDSQNEREMLEAKLTALLLGELPAHEEAALHRAMDEDPELGALYERLKVTIDLVRSAESGVRNAEGERAEGRRSGVEGSEAAGASAFAGLRRDKELKLPPEKREKLLAHFKTVRPKEFVETPRKRVLFDNRSNRIIEWAAVAAVILLIAAIGVPNFVRTRETSRKNTVINNLRLLDGAKQTWALEANASPNAIPNPAQVAPFFGRGGTVETDFAPIAMPGVKYVVGKIDEKPGIETSVSQARRWMGGQRIPKDRVHNGRVELSMGELMDQKFEQNPNPRPPVTVIVGGVHSEFGPSTLAKNGPVINYDIATEKTAATAPTAAPLPSMSLQVEPSTPKTEIVLPSSNEAGGNGEFALNEQRQTAAPALVPPSAETIVTANGGTQPRQGDYRFYLDLNRDGTTVTNGVAGDQEWIGILEPPEQSQPSNSAFVARYASLATPESMSAGVSGYTNFAGFDDKTAGEFGKSLAAAASNNDSYNLQTSYRMLSQSDSGGAQSNFNMNLSAFLSDIPSTRTAYRGDAGSVETNGQFYTGLPHEDVNGLRYVDTNGVVASQPIAGNGAVSAVSMSWNTFDGSTNAVTTVSGELVQNGGDLGLAGTNSVADRLTIDGVTLADNSQTAKDTKRTRGTVAWTTDTHNKVGNVTLADGSVQQVSVSGARRLFQNSTNAVQNGFASAAPEAAPAAPKTEIALPPEPSTGVPVAGEIADFGGAGSVAHLPKPAVGGKQVEMAAVAHRGTPWMTDLKKPADSGSNDFQSSAVKPAPISTNVFAANAVGYTASDEAEKRTELAAAEQKLQAEKHWLEILKMKTGAEGVDKDLPKGRMVTIVDPATIATTEKAGIGEKIRQIFSGKVERTTSVTVEQEHTDIAGAKGGPVSYDAYFPQTELKVIQSDAVLKKAAEFLNTDKNGSVPQVTVAQLRKDLDLRPVKNSKEIEIGARSETADQATRIANAVAAAYRDYRLEQYNEVKSREMQALQQQMVEQEKKVELAQAKLDQLAKQVQSPAAAANAQAVNQPDTTLPKPALPAPTPQPEMLTRENAFSTFSMNVSDVSFKLAAASLEKGQMPEPAAIRSEEFINAFDYRDPQAAPGVPVAFAQERALYPFAHNRELLRFSVKTAAAGRQAGRPLNIVLLLDNSGSMERADRVRIIQKALHVLAGQLQAQDTFSIVTFARTPRLRVDGIPGNQAAAAADEVGKFTPEGGTDLGDALDLAYETALHHYLANGDNRVVLLTDGAANLGDVDSNSLKQKVETHRKQGIALDCFGIGWEGYNDDLLEVLTRDGDGRYGFINTPEEASTEFVSQIAGALHVAAADVKVQVEFNPDRVISYRQIGYAKHQLTKEQFRDNTVAAGQIAAQEAGNALYTIEVNPQGQGSIGTVRVRYKVPDTGEVREQSWDVPYTGGAVSMDQASPAMRLAATASAFSEWLATSPFAEQVTTDQLLNYLNGVPQVYGADTRPQKLEWMIRQAKSTSGK